MFLLLTSETNLRQKASAHSPPNKQMHSTNVLAPTSKHFNASTRHYAKGKGRGPDVWVRVVWVQLGLWLATAGGAKVHGKLGEIPL